VKLEQGVEDAPGGSFAPVQTVGDAFAVPRENRFYLGPEGRRTIVVFPSRSKEFSIRRTILRPVAPGVRTMEGGRAQARFNGLRHPDSRSKARLALFLPQKNPKGGGGAKRTFGDARQV